MVFACFVVDLTPLLEGGVTNAGTTALGCLRIPARPPRRFMFST